MEKEVFERLLTEFTENNTRAEKLRSFILGEKFNELDNLNRDLLIAQLKAMEAYLSVLSIRIGLNAPREEVMQEAPAENFIGFNQIVDEVPDAEPTTEE